jgi:hypothetical protein
VGRMIGMAVSSGRSKEAPDAIMRSRETATQPHSTYALEKRERVFGKDHA